jgi:ribosomal protein S18 acetylase RimI-like enzyme
MTEATEPESLLSEPGTITLRAATDADQDFLVAVFASTRADELQVLAWNPIQAEMFVTIQYNAQQQSYRFSYPAAENNIILRDGQPIGRMLVDRSEQAIHLVDIAILPEYRNLGVGAELIGGLLSEGAAKGREVALSVFHTNPAIHLYERLGFLKVDEDSLYWKMRWLPEPASSKSSTNTPV